MFGMPSRAYTDHLIPLLNDATEIDDAHRELRTGEPGRQWRLGALNRAAVVMCLSAWEAYIEVVVIEAIASFRPAAQPSLWQSIVADARGKIGRFNAPNVENVQRLIADTIGLQDVSVCWVWQNTDRARARQRLTDAINYRHQIAHGVNPRPTIHNQYSHSLPAFFRQLSRATDEGVRTYLIDTLHVAHPWPA